MGRRWGPRLLRSTTARRHADTIDAAERYLRAVCAVFALALRRSSSAA
jgi:hypothetical protein